MRIALLSFEYDGKASGGGIGTYVRQAAAMLHGCGHCVEVFTAEVGDASGGDVPWAVHRVDAARADFAAAIVPIFSQRHGAHPFDVVEGPEYGADAASVAAAFREIALVVKLHAPGFTIAASNAHYISCRTKLRFILGALRRGRWPHVPWRYRPAEDVERRHTLEADEVAANSAATAKRIQAMWGVRRSRLSVVPLPFTPSDALLAIPAATTTNTILFLGRVEVRKGVLDLARAIPLICAEVSGLRFRFVGRILDHPGDHRPLSDHIRELAGGDADAVELTGGVSYGEVVDALRNADICVLPSDWEAAGFTCLEAMAAARGVVASSAGGMAEMIDPEVTGILIPPRDPARIAAAVLALVRDPTRRIAMGTAARQAAATMRRPDVIAPQQLASYSRAIAVAATRRAERSLEA
jgi:glycosyltransferase involved in cell wall biosynthesis